MSMLMPDGASGGSSSSRVYNNRGEKKKKKSSSSSSSRTSYSGGRYGPNYINPADVPAPAPAPSAPKPVRQPSSGGSNRSSGGGGSSSGRTSSSGGGGGSNTFSTASAPAPEPEKPKEPPKPNFKEWLGGDALYNSLTGEGGTVQTELDALLSTLGEQNRQYGQDIDSALRNLGWSDSLNGGKGGWNAQDKIGAYGQAHTNARNDFSSRGLMDSSFFADMVQNLDSNFERQRNDYGEALERQNTNYRTETDNAKAKAEAARRQARADAQARYAAMYGEV